MTICLYYVIGLLKVSSLRNLYNITLLARNLLLSHYVGQCHSYIKSSLELYKHSLVLSYGH